MDVGQFRLVGRELSHSADRAKQLLALYHSGLYANQLRLSQSKQQLIGVQTTVVQREKLFRTIRAVGQLTADETKLAHVHLKVSGWIEQVYVDYVGKLV